MDVDLLKKVTVQPQKYYIETERTVIGQVRLVLFSSYNVLTPADIVDRHDKHQSI